MAKTAKKTDPKLWEKVKEEVTESDKGGKPGQWSARKAQLAVHDYKAEGGGYEGEKSADNHLAQWTREDWGTKSGEESGKSGERDLPEKAREALSDDEYRRTTEKKQADTRKGRQHSAQPADVAGRTGAVRHASERDGMTRAALLQEASKAGIAGRSRMKKAELVAALGGRKG